MFEKKPVIFFGTISFRSRCTFQLDNCLWLNYCSLSVENAFAVVRGWCSKLKTRKSGMTGKPLVAAISGNAVLENSPWAFKQLDSTGFYSIVPRLVLYLSKHSKVKVWKDETFAMSLPFKFQTLNGLSNALKETNNQ